VPVLSGLGEWLIEEFDWEVPRKLSFKAPYPEVDAIVNALSQNLPTIEIFKNNRPQKEPILIVDDEITKSKLPSRSKKSVVGKSSRARNTTTKAVAKIPAEHSTDCTNILDDAAEDDVDEEITEFAQRYLQDNKETATEEAERITKVILKRKNQRKLRKNITEQDSCLICRKKGKRLLQVCHILPFSVTSFVS
jgi:hypothetical protein